MSALSRAVMGVEAPRLIQFPSGPDSTTTSLEQDGSELGKGWSRGVSGVSTGLQAALGQVVQPFSPETGTGIITEAQRQADDVQRRYPAEVGRFADVHNAEDFAKYAMGTAAQVAPMLPLAYAGGLAGRAITGTGVGAQVGGTLAYAPQMMGDEAMQLQRDPTAAGMTPVQKLGYAAGVGTGRAAFEAAVPAAMGGSLIAPGVQNLAKTLVANPIRNTVLEGGAEGASDVLGQTAQRIYNPAKQIDWEQAKEATIAGTVGMAPYSMAHSVPETIASKTQQGANAVGPAADAIRVFGQDAVDKAGELSDKVFDSLSPETKQAWAEGRAKLDDVLIEATDTATKAAASVQAGAEEITHVAKTAYEGAAKAVREEYTPEAVKPLAEVHQLVTGEAPKAEEPAQMVKSMVKFMLDPQLMGKDFNTYKQRINNPEKRKALVGALEAMADESEVVNDSEFRRLLDVAKSDQPLDAQTAARLGVLATSLVNTHTKLDALTRLSKWQGETGRVVPKAGDVDFSKSGDVVNKSVREVFSSSQMRSALSDMDITKEAVNRVVRNVSNSIQAKDLTARGLTRLANERATETLGKLGLQNRTDLHNAITEGIKAALEQHVSKLPEETRHTGTDISDTFKQNIGAAMEQLFSGQGKKAMPETAADKAKYVKVAADFVESLTKGDALHQRNASGFTNTMVKQWGDTAMTTMQHIVEAARIEYGVDSKQFKNVERLVNGSTGLVQRTAAAIGPHLSKEAAKGGSMRAASKLMDAVRTALSQDRNKSDNPEQQNYDDNLAMSKLFLKLKEAGVLRGSGEEAMRRSFDEIVEGLRLFDTAPDRLDRPETTSGESRARTTLGEPVEDLDKPSFAQGEAESTPDVYAKADTAGEISTTAEKSVPSWVDDQNAEHLGADSVAPSAVTYHGTGIRDTSGRGVGGSRGELGAPLTNMPSADFPHGMTRDEKIGVKQLVHAESGHRVAAGKEIKVAKWADDMAKTEGGDPEMHMQQALKALLAYDKMRAEKLKKIVATGTPEERSQAGKDLDFIQMRANLAKALDKLPNKGARFFDDALGMQFHYYRTMQESGENLHLGPEELKMFAMRDDETPQMFHERMRKRDDHPFPASKKVYENSVMEIQTKDGPLLVDIARIVADVMAKHQKGDVGVTELQAFHEVMGAIQDGTGIKQTARLHTTKRGQEFYDKDLIIHRESDSGGAGLRGERRTTRYGDHSGNASLDAAGRMVSESMLRDADGKIVRTDPGMLATPKAPLSNLMPKKITREAKPYVAEGMVTDKNTSDANRNERNLNLRSVLARMLERNNLDSTELLGTGQDLTPSLVAALLHSAFKEMKAVLELTVDTGTEKFDSVAIFDKQYGKDQTHAVKWGQIRKEVNKLEANERAGTPNEWVPRNPELVSRMDAKKQEATLQEALNKFLQKDTQRAARKAIGRESLLDDADKVAADREALADTKDRLDSAVRKQAGDEFDPNEGTLRQADEVIEAIKAASPTGKIEDAPLFDYSNGAIATKDLPVLRALEKLDDAIQNVKLSDGSVAQLRDTPTGETYAMRDTREAIDAMDAIGAAREALNAKGNDLFGHVTGAPTGAGLSVSAHGAALNRVSAAYNAEGKAGGSIEPAKGANKTSVRDAKDEGAPVTGRAGPKRPLNNPNTVQEVAPVGTQAGREALKAAARAAKAAAEEAAAERAAEAATPRKTPENMVSGLKKATVVKAEPDYAFDAKSLAAELAGESYNGAKHPKLMGTLSEAEKAQLGQELRAMGDELEAHSAGSKLLKILPTKEVEVTPTSQNFGDPFSKTAATDKIWHDGMAREEVEQLMQAHVDKLLSGLKIKIVDQVLDNDGNSVAASYSKSLKQALISAWAPDGVGALNHEVWHGIEDALLGMGKEGEHVVKAIHAATMTPMMDAMLKKRYADDPGALSQMNDPKERASYAFQLFNENGGKLPMPAEAKGFFTVIKEWIMDMIGLTKGETKSENFFKYVVESGMVRDFENPYAVLRALGETKTDKFITNTKEAMKPLKEMFDAVVTGGRERVLNHENEFLNKIVDAYEGNKHGKGGFHVEHVTRLNQFGHLMEEVVKGASEADLQKVSTFEQKVIKPFRAYMDAQLGVGAFDRLAERTSSFNRHDVSENMQEFMSDLIRHGGLEARDGLDKAGVARSIATKVADRGYYYHPDITLFKDAPEIAVKWMDKSIEKQMYDQIIQGTRMVERDRAFGKRTKEAPMGEKVAALLKQAEDGGASKEAMRDIKSYMDGFDGKHDTNMSPEMKKLVGGILFLENAINLPFAMTSQLIEPFQLAMRKNDLPSVLHATWRGIKDFPRMFEKINKGYNKDYWEHFSELAGTAKSRVLGESIAQLSNGIASRGITGKMNDMFFRYNGMDGWDRSMHIEATMHAVEFLQDHANNIDPKHSARFLKELGITAEEVNAAKQTAMYEGSAYKTLDYTNDKVRRAVNQYVNEALAHPDAGSNPFWMNDPRFALIAQMKRFSFGFSTYVNDRNMREILDHENFGVAPAMIAAVPWALLFVDPIKHIVKDSPMKTMGFFDATMRGIELTGQMGKGAFVNDAIRQATFGGSAVASLLGPTASSIDGLMKAGAMAGAAN